MAKGRFFSEVADLHGISTSSVSRAIAGVIPAINRHVNNIKFPMTNQDLLITKRKFFSLARFPNVIGAVDGTLIPVIAPSENEPDFVCRKGYHAVNIQGIVDTDLRYLFEVFFMLTIFIIYYHFIFFNEITKFYSNF